MFAQPTEEDFIAQVTEYTQIAAGKFGAVDELRADLETITSQLRKPKPAEAILREAGKSIRTISENIIAGALTPEVMAAATLLAASLGS